jgi:hypothetical protein
VIGSLTRCAQIARTDAPPIRGVLDLVPDGAGIPGTPDLRFRALADVIPGMRQVRQDTANAVGCTTLRGSNPRSSAAHGSMPGVMAVGTPESSVTRERVMPGSLIARHAGSMRGRSGVGRRHVTIRARCPQTAAGDHLGRQQFASTAGADPRL